MNIVRKKDKTLRIVLADDQAEVREALRRFIEKDGTFEVVAEARSGDEAIDVVNSQHPDALILDLAMPGVDGLFALAAIMKSAPATRVVVLSSMVPFNGIKAKAIALGAVDAFDKYTSPKKVLKALTRSLSSAPVAQVS